MQIIQKSEIVARMAKAHQEEIQSVIKTLNEKLREATDLPVKLPLSALGSNYKVLNEVLRLLHEAGWRHYTERVVTPGDANSSIIVEIS